MFMGVFHSWSRTWIFEIEIGALTMGCWIAEYQEPLKNLDNRTCLRAFPQTPRSCLTTIHPINTTDCSTIVSGKYLWFDVTTTLCYPFYPFELVPYTSQVHTLFSTHPSRSQKPLKHSVDNIKINLNSQKPPKPQQQPSCPTRRMDK